MLDFELNIDVEKIILKENIDNSFKEIFDIETFSVDVNNSDEDFNRIFQEEFVPKNDMSFNVELDNKSSVYDADFRKHFGLHSFNIFCESNSNNDFNSSFQDFFNLNIDPENVDIEEEVPQVTEEVVEVQKVEEVVEVEEKFPFRIELNEGGTVFDYDFRKHFNIHNFETCVDRDRSVDDSLFQEYFEVRCESSYDYNIINNLKKKFSSRKVLTRDDVPDQEVDIYSLDETKKTSVSIEEKFEKKSSSIKEKAFYKIVEVGEEIEEKVLPEPKIETPNLDEFERKVNGLEEKYEDLLQKTKDQYENQMNKMTEEFATFRNNIASQVSRMAIASSSGGGAVNILDMDDVDRTNLQNGYSLSYNSTLKKFQFIDIGSVGSTSTLDLMHSFCFEITQTHLDNQYFDLPFPSDSRYDDLSEIIINGIQNNSPDQYTFSTRSRIDTSNLTLDLGDKIRIFYIKS